MSPNNFPLPPPKTPLYILPPFSQTLERASLPRHRARVCSSPPHLQPIAMVSMIILSLSLPINPPPSISHLPISPLPHCPADLQVQERRSQPHQVHPLLQLRQVLPKGQEHQEVPGEEHRRAGRCQGHPGGVRLRWLHATEALREDVVLRFMHDPLPRREGEVPHREEEQ